MRHQNSLKKLLESVPLPSGADWLGIRSVAETTHYWSMRDGKPETNVTEKTEGLMVEVIAGGQIGYAATPVTTPEAVRRAADLACAQARQAAPHGIHRFSQEQRPASKGEYRSPLLKPAGLRTPGEINGLLIQACGKMKVSPKIIRTHAAVHIVETEIKQVSTAGTDVQQAFQMTSFSFSATAQDGSIVQRRSDGENLQSGIELLDLPDFLDRARRVGEQALELVSAEECPTETTSLVLMPDQMMLQIHESIGHPLELDRILGDERNYAGWSFVRPGDFGKLVYGSPLMNVTFDPTVRGEFASYAFDDGGAPATREHLIKGGILLRGLGGLESQARSGIAGVANFRASSWNRAPIDRMANLNLEPGEATLDEIIGSVKRGILMETNRSWSIDDYRNKFQFGCEYSRLIENGKLTKTLRNPNYRGITNPFWRGLKKVGNAGTLKVHGTPNCGKGEPNQVIRVGHASPVCLFENVEVFGGAS